MSNNTQIVLGIVLGALILPASAILANAIASIIIRIAQIRFVNRILSFILAPLIRMDERKREKLMREKIRRMMGDRVNKDE